MPKDEHPPSAAKTQPLPNPSRCKSLWRYPVKSLLGEPATRLEVDRRGVVGDRLFAIANVDGKFGSGKDTQRFRRIDGLFTLAATTIADGVSITFPDGAVLTSASADLDEKLSAVLGQTVRLVREADVSHFDDGPIHILTTSALAQLQELLPTSVADARRFRANLVIDTPSPITDDELLGRTIQIGNVTLEVTHKAERCRMVALPQGSLQRDPELAKVLVKQFGMHFGVYASVVATGSIHVGDAVAISNGRA